ncbi:hypothetical protein BDFB_012550, partial [Asbolus verrucosus]
QFDVNRSELYKFIANCDNAEKFAHSSQKDALLTFIISRLTGNPRAQLSDKEVRHWFQLKNAVLQLYSDKKHQFQLMEELNTMKQNPSESRNGHSIDECFHKNKNSPKKPSYQTNRQVMKSTNVESEFIIIIAKGQKIQVQTTLKMNQ